MVSTQYMKVTLREKFPDKLTYVDLEDRRTCDMILQIKEKDYISAHILVKVGKYKLLKLPHKFTNEITVRKEY